MKKNFFLLIISLFIISCSSDSGGDSGNDNDGGGNNNGGGNSGSGDSTDPSDYTSTTSPGDTTYYVSFNSGNDENDGKSEDKPFKNLGKINSITFNPGDIIKFKSGESWKGYFKLRGSGSEDKPISIENYSSGNKPIIDGDGYQAAVFIENMEYVNISGLELTNQASHKFTNGSVKLMDQSSRSGLDLRFGLLVLRHGSGNIRNISLSDIKISDIYPTPNNSDNNHQGYGIRFESLNDDNVLNYYNGIQMENLDILNTGHYGIHIVNRMSGAQADYYHRNIVIKNSKFTDNGGSGIVLARCKDVVVENSEFKGSGSGKDSRMWNRGSSLWTYTCNDTVIQNNLFEDVYGPADSYGAHIDWGCERVVIQYNLSKNNYGGFAEILGENIMCGYRYNISIADGGRTNSNTGRSFWVSDYAGSNDRRIGSVDNFIYNNTVFIPSENASNNNAPFDHLQIFIRPNTKETYIYNNLIYISDKAKLKIDTRNDGLLNDWKNNLFFGNLVIDGASDYEHNGTELFSNPLLSNPGGSTANDYKLQSSSPAIGAGFIINGSSDMKNYIQNNGGKDYFGNTVSSDSKPNIGAYNGN